MNESFQRELARDTLTIVFLAAMILACFWIMRPFLPAIIWGAMIVIATWPLLLKIQHRLWGRRRLAVAAMTVLLLLLFIIPCALAIGTIVENRDQIVHWVKMLADLSLPVAPEWLGNLPFVGKLLVDSWQKILATSPDEMAARIAPFSSKIARWLASQAGSFGVMFIHFLLTVVVAAVMYSYGEQAADGIRRFARRLAGQRGDAAALLAAQAIRAVALGVIVTAFVQSVMAGIGLAVVGVKYATLLTALIFVLTIAQISALPVLIPCVIWLYWQGSPGWGTALLVWSMLVGTIDNFLRPILIRRGANIPLLLILLGVIGGLIAFGFIGLFIGPMVLAVSYTLVVEWVAAGEQPQDATGDSDTGTSAAPSTSAAE